MKRCSVLTTLALVITACGSDDKKDENKSTGPTTVLETSVASCTVMASEELVVCSESSKISQVLAQQIVAQCVSEDNPDHMFGEIEECENKDESVGSCLVTEGVPVTQTHYYSGMANTVEVAEASCVQSGGVFTPAE